MCVCSRASGSKLDVSWALVQREAKNMLNNEAELRLSLTGGSLPNRVVHPPSVSIRREAAPDSSVIVENLVSASVGLELIEEDSFLFPDTDTVSSIFKTFGPIQRVVKLTDSPLSVLIQFEHPVSATALVNANGLQLGDRVLKTRPFAAPMTPGAFDPFAEASRRWLDEAAYKTGPVLPQTPQSLPPRGTRLSADSVPFVPNSKADESPLAHAGKMVGKMKAALANHVISLDSDSSDSGKESEHSDAGCDKVATQIAAEEKA